MYKDIAYMGTTHRHNELSLSFFGNLFELIKNRKIVILGENVSLVHFGRKGRGEICRLVDISKFNDIELNKFKSGLINDLEVIQPDFCMFYKNPHCKNERDTRLAGIPDLIVEVWSESNDEIDIQIKKSLYSESDTEHWYITQDSNLVECFIGNQEVKSQSLTDILVTKVGLKFDLRYLAI